MSYGDARPGVRNNYSYATYSSVMLMLGNEC